MKQVIILKGLPACGKTTFCKQAMDKDPGRYKRVNKDDLRGMIDGGQWSPKNEKFVLKLRDDLILRYLEEGKHVFVDDTNLHPKHEARIRELVKGKAQVIIKEFHPAPQVCIENDLKRPNSVGAKVIWDMYNDFLKPKEEIVTYTPPAGKPKAIIVDIDGTVALMGNKRGPYDWDKVGGDDVNEAVVDLIDNCRPASHEDDPIIIFVSGREGSCLKATKKWLDSNGVSRDEDLLYLRQEGDTRKDSIVKQEIFDEHIRDHYDVQFVLDDRNQTVAMWRSLGLTCLQVADGNF